MPFELEPCEIPEIVLVKPKFLEILVAIFLKVIKNMSEISYGMIQESG